MMRKQIYFSPSCLMSLSWRWHALRARSHGNSTWECAPCVSHGTGKAEWLLYFTASGESILTKSVAKKLHIGSFLIAVLKSWWEYVFQLLVRWIPWVLYWTIFWSYSSVHWKPYKHTITSIQTKMAFTVLRQGSSAQSQSTHLLVE